MVAESGSLDPMQLRKMTVALGHWEASTAAEGPGQRLALWFQGCPLRCDFCCNPGMLGFEGGTERDMQWVLRQLTESKINRGIEGVTLLGGEPTAQPNAAATIADLAQQLDLSVMVFSGWTLEYLQSSHEASILRLLDLTDILVDGRYRHDLPESSRRWVGSRNQRVHFLSDRYHPDDACWKQPNTIEIRITAEGIRWNGFPVPEFPRQTGENPAIQPSIPSD